MKYMDFRNDTVTHPIEEMGQAMYEAKVGDDVFLDDPTGRELERQAAQSLGMEEGLFLPSGIMANQVSIMYHTKMGDEIILNKGCRYSPT